MFWPFVGQQLCYYPKVENTVVHRKTMLWLQFLCCSYIKYEVSVRCHPGYPVCHSLWDLPNTVTEFRMDQTIPELKEALSRNYVIKSEAVWAAIYQRPNKRLWKDLELEKGTIMTAKCHGIFKYITTGHHPLSFPLYLSFTDI